MNEWFSTDGPIFAWLDKLGQMILLSLLWLVGCIPIVTIATSTTALYYAVIKSVRRGRGDALKEFFHSYKANLRRGIPVTVVTLLLSAVLYGNVHISLAQGDGALPTANLIALAILLLLTAYICPILSRFTMRVRDVWKLSFVMAIRFLPYTLLLAVGTVAVVTAQVFLLPMPTVLILPSVWCLITTYPVEKALRAYMPEKKPEDDAWYYE